MEGIIIKNQSNDYTVRTKKGVYVCKPRGKFRQVGITPLVGDTVVIDDVNKYVHAKGIEYDELLDEIEAIVYSGTKLDIDYYIDDVMDEEHMLDIYDYFLEESETDSLDEAVEELGEDYPERDIRLVRIKFLSEMAN